MQEDVSSVSADLSATPAFSGVPAIKPPLTPCGGAFNTRLVDNLGNIYANVQIMNNENLIYIMISTQGSWVLSDFYLHVGKHADVPTDPMSEMLEDDFQHIDRAVDRYTMYTYVVDVSAIGTCPDLIISSTVKFMDGMGVLSNPQHVWLDGIDYLDGKFLNYCMNACPTKYAGPSSSTL